MLGAAESANRLNGGQTHAIVAALGGLHDGGREDRVRTVRQGAHHECGAICRRARQFRGDGLGDFWPRQLADDAQAKLK